MIVKSKSSIVKVVIAFMVMMTMCFGMVGKAFASDTGMQKLNANESEIELFEAASPITSAVITDVLLDDSNNHVYALVKVMGYGSTFGYIDGMRVDLLKTTTIGSPVVKGFVYWFDCGVLSSGSHTFRYSGTSYNSPWNTVSTQVTFQVP